MFGLMFAAAIAAAVPAVAGPASAAQDAQLVFLDGSQMAEVCGAAPEGKLRLGCAGVTAEGVAFVAVPDPCLLPKADLYASILCEAITRANGSTER